MNEALAFPDLLRLIDERSAAFRAAVAGAPDLGVRVPTCPEWTLWDLVRHLGDGRRSWAATVAAGPDVPGRLPSPGPAAPEERAALSAWLAESTRLLLDAVREAGPDRGCWTWWGASQSPRTCGAVARHQLQEISVHTYDAQLAVGDGQPLPAVVALDGVEDFVFTVCATTGAWPHEPAVVDYHATEGRSWRVWLSGDGARAARLAGSDTAADVSARGTASELVLALYGRRPMESVDVAGDRRIFDRLFAWEPEV
ncbi:maleylpyruvate isomerase family mycothiol-dependent enzyme [Micromonospora sp. WMMD1120]|uniref:maleylpyruvate isomerase family mycothiol-dependent enzyme n=1 Tax=Micromonospora sp. WMMD1120 TaxID=3016106 RepID=UPI002415E4C7|nr:maleylpyruvate isomerase family mycothiol-dependent enzyme [Micromonospora sp. WMMD1120]MDG4810126.1 maleylpyruvate isomerase family mycothiol-dependent enzyme [Micromonospora sp. WMMD1120]